MLSPARRQALVLLAGAAAAAAGAKSLRPTEYLAQTLGPINLENTIPRSFGSWQTDPQSPVFLITGEQEQLLARLYSEMLTRTYVQAGNGYRIMLSIAYGADQSDSLSMHYPDVCYPAQGFTVLKRDTSKLTTGRGQIPTTRLLTRMGTRHEPVTYWTIIAKTAVLSGLERKIFQLRYSLLGLIPDGLLFRVSSVDSDASRGFSSHEKFVSELVDSLPASTAIPRLFGFESNR